MQTNTKAQAFAQLAEDTATHLTSSLVNWTGFLATVGNLYKYPYHEQLMIYAQKPDATACADYELWNNKMNRFVRRGSTGIALLDPTGDTPKLKYVFDVSDTGGRDNSRRPFLWEMREHHEQPILEMLEDKFGVSGENLADGFYNIAKDLAAEYYDNHKEDLPYLAENSFLEDYDEDNLRVAFENAATVSIMERYDLIPGTAQLARIKKYQQEGKLDANVIDAILTEERPAPVQVILKGESIKRFFPKEYTQRQVEEVVFSLLENWRSQTTSE